MYVAVRGVTSAGWLYNIVPVLLLALTYRDCRGTTTAVYVAVCGVNSTGWLYNMVPVLLPGAYDTGNIEGPLLLFSWHEILLSLMLAYTNTSINTCYASSCRQVLFGRYGAVFC